MASIRAAFAAYGATALFVLLWSSGAIFAELGVQHASAAAFLLLRFALASLVLAIVAAVRGRWLPARGTRLQVAGAGALLTGGYSICYFLALERGLTPGIAAVILGAQPILTLLATERRFSVQRIAGLIVALAGLAAIVLFDDHTLHSTADGMTFALLALVCMTMGAIAQKRIKQGPIDVLPLQNFIGLVLCALFAPFEPWTVAFDMPLLVSLFWLAIVISIAAQLLFFVLVRRGNLVNVTSLFYLVPVVTALMDYVFLGNALRPKDVAGMAAILLGLALVSMAGPQVRRGREASVQRPQA